LTIERPRATGFYATLEGREFHATTSGENVVLRVYQGEDVPEGFSASAIPTVAGIRIVARASLDQLVYVKSMCKWQGEPFSIVAMDGAFLFVFYLGEKGDWMVGQPGMYRTGKLETCGYLEPSACDEIVEFVNPIPVR
jgi:hypothetical protein